MLHTELLLELQQATRQLAIVSTGVFSSLMRHVCSQTMFPIRFR